MILKFKSSALFDETVDGLPPVVIPEQDWTWVDDVQRVQICDQIEIPLSDDEDAAVNLGCYQNSSEHFAEAYWVGVNPRLYAKHTMGPIERPNNTYVMCYVYRRSGKVDLLAIGFLADVFLLNDEGKTIDRIVNEPW